MITETLYKNFIVGHSPYVLYQIIETDKNIAIYERSISHLHHEIETLIKSNTHINVSGHAQYILDCLQKDLSHYQIDNILNDIETLLSIFNRITQAQSFRLLLATINTNMCRRFHTDVNDLRMLCTYSGPGTLWLTEDNVNREALETCKDNECIVKDESKIQQAPTGSVVILKGAIYPQQGTKAIVHRSPTIEESGEKRLLLRIDTNEFLKFE